MLWLDCASENKAIEARCQSLDWQPNIDFEHMARPMQQQNSQVVTGFTIAAARARATRTAVLDMFLAKDPSQPHLPAWVHQTGIN